MKKFIHYSKIKSIQTSIFTVFLVPPAQETTLAKQIALKISEHNTPVYYVENINANLKDLINELEKKSPQKYLVFIERIADSAQIIGEILSEQN
ncbi:hypothetical protein J4730_20335 [Klebsiella pneumoniae]|uniref:Uncharacterized protein n=1 Tax=Klebsiella pneumoniae TaxID=573 RepID=A0A939NPK7_KLEPN|nr:hypothetical protein [Klebsiella pneumoniae]